MILKNLFHRKMRSLLTLVGISIGIAAIVALGAMGAGMEAGYRAMLSGSQADLVLSQADSYDITLSAIDERVGQELLAMPEVKDVAGMLMGNVSSEGGARYFFVFGYEPQEFGIERFKIVEGEGLRARHSRGRPLLLGKLAADSLDKEVGDTLKLTGGTFRIVGVYETGDAFEEGGGR